MMAADLARALDPVILAKDCGIEPDPWQADLLRSTSTRVLLLSCRQSGKSTTCGVMALDTALHKPTSLTLVLSPSQRQSAEFHRTVTGMHSRLKGACPMRAESVLRSEFENGSRIIALPGTETTIRGYAAPDLVIIDEASRVDDALLAGVRPMLATKPDARLIALTTPAGKRGWFYDAWHGDGEWDRIKIPAEQCPRISAEFLAEELRELGPELYSQEYGLSFVEDNEAVFPLAVIQAAFTDQVRPLWQ